MSLRRLRFPHLVLALGATVAWGMTTDDANACGGCFHLDQGGAGEASVVVAHRMAVSISTEQTILWDQVQYAGNPADFAWVLPIKPGARLELGTDAFFDTLEAATQAMVVSPELHCLPAGGGMGDDFGGGYYGDESGGCCGGSSDAYAGDGGESLGAGNTGNTGNTAPPPPPPVEVVHHATVGPYETVTLSANQEGVLQDWLTDHGYAVDASIEPVIEAYVAEGFDFIAMRLAPGAGVQQMQPVRVVSPGAEPTLPLRMVAAGTGAEVDLTLFVISEGRWQAENFPNGAVDPLELTWDVGDSSSNYAALREEALAEEMGRTWLTSYARERALLAPIADPLTNASMIYEVEGAAPQSTIAGAYFGAGAVNGEGGDLSQLGASVCADKALAIASSMDRVVWACDDEGVGGSGGMGGSGGTGGIGSGGMGGIGSGGMGGMGSGGTGGMGPEGEIPCEVPGPGTIAAQELVCGDLDDVAVALIGLHPADVWITRLEASLPRGALDLDFALEPASSQDEVQNRHVASTAVNTPCDESSLVPMPVAKPPRPNNGGSSRSDRARFAMIALLGLGLLAVARRRARVPARA